jgi:hypothetical protein
MNNFNRLLTIHQIIFCDTFLNQKFTLVKNFTYFKEEHRQNSTTLGHNFLGSTTESLTLYGLNHPTEGGLN